MEDEKQFGGFTPPVSNYFRMPNEWINISAKITNLAELKVVEYVLRHTWGFQEYDGKPKAITTDEFMHGRKDKHGNRMDDGTGLSNKSVVEGLKRAIDHGFLVSETNDADRARIVKSYALKMTAPNSDMKDLHITSYVGSTHPAMKNLHSGVNNLHSDCVETTHRSEKDTKERNLKKNKNERKSVEPANDEPKNSSHSSSHSSLSSSQEKTEVVFSQEENAVYALCCQHLFPAKHPEKTEKLKQQCSELAPHIKSGEQLVSLIAFTRKEQKLEDKPLYLGNLTKTLNGWLQVQQQKPKEVVYTVGNRHMRPFREQMAR